MRKLRGSLAKLPRRTDKRGSGPSDLDLAAQVQRILDLIWIAGFRSGGRGSFAGDNGGNQSPAVSRAAGPRQNSPYSALRGLIQPVLGSGRLRKARVMHLGHLRGVARCGAPCTAAEKVLWRRSCRRARVGNGAGLRGVREHICWAGVGAGRRGRGWAAHGPRGGRGKLGWCGLLGQEGRSGPPGWVGFGFFFSYFFPLFYFKLNSN